MQPTRGSNFLYEWVLFCVYFSVESRVHNAYHIEVDPKQ